MLIKSHITAHIFKYFYNKQMTVNGFKIKINDPKGLDVVGPYYASCSSSLHLHCLLVVMLLVLLPLNDVLLQCLCLLPNYHAYGIFIISFDIIIAISQAERCRHSPKWKRSGTL